MAVKLGMLIHDGTKADIGKGNEKDNAICNAIWRKTRALPGSSQFLCNILNLFFNAIFPSQLFFPLCICQHF